MERGRQQNESLVRGSLDRRIRVAHIDRQRVGVDRQRARTAIELLGRRHQVGDPVSHELPAVGETVILLTSPLSVAIETPTEGRGGVQQNGRLADGERPSQTASSSSRACIPASPG